MSDPTAAPPQTDSAAASPSARSVAPGGTCTNCGHRLAGRYCPACGQKDEPLQKPAHPFVRDTVAELVGIEGRELRTLGALLFKPGTLTRAYVAGRRHHYLRPLRVYLLATLGFFFLLTVLDPVERLRAEIVRTDDDTTTVAAHLAENDALAGRAHSPRSIARGPHGCHPERMRRISTRPSSPVEPVAMGWDVGPRSFTGSG